MTIEIKNRLHDMSDKKDILRATMTSIKKFISKYLSMDDFIDKKYTNFNTNDDVSNKEKHEKTDMGDKIK